MILLIATIRKKVIEEILFPLKSQFHCIYIRFYKVVRGIVKSSLVKRKKGFYFEVTTILSTQNVS